MSRFAGKICLVTASTQGIGFACAERMAREGGTVIICSRKKENVDEALSKLKAFKVEGFVCDVSKKETRKIMIDKIREKYGKIDVLVLNHACSTYFGSQLDITERAFDKLIEMNIKSFFFFIVETIDMLRAAGPGANILIVSSYTAEMPSYTIGVYGMTKAALNNMVIFL